MKLIMMKNKNCKNLIVKIKKKLKKNYEKIFFLFIIKFYHTFFYLIKFINFKINLYYFFFKININKNFHII